MTATGGEWTNAGSWDLGVPVNGDIVIIPNGVTITITGTTVNFNGTVNIEAGGTLSLINNGSDAILNMDAASTVNLFTGPPAGQVISSGGFLGFINFNRIVIGGTVAFNGFVFGGDGNTLSGPLTLDQTGQGPLPIELIYFVASGFHQHTNLTWATASEENFDYFEVQRAIGSIDFKPIGEIKGAGADTHNIQEYEFVDEKPLNGINYYRLKSIDLDGTFEYSPIQSIKFSFDSRFQVYPNPASGHELNILIDDVEPHYEYIVYDNMGLIVQKGSITGGDQTYALPNLKSGVYHVKLIGRGDNPVKKLVVH